MDRTVVPWPGPPERRLVGLKLTIEPQKIQIQMEYMKINKPLSAMNFEDVRRLLNG